MKISFYSLGCKLNQAENNEIRERATAFGWQVVPFDEPADFCIVNTCSVTAGAEQRSRQMIRAAKRNGAKVIAAGCHRQQINDAEAYLKTPDEVIEYLSSISGVETPSSETFETSETPETFKRTRAFIKIQNGCNYQCAYCIIPSLRGKSTSRPQNEIINEIKQRVDQGFREVVLTGVNVCQYLDEQTNLVRLVQRVLDETSIERIRFGSLDPRLITPEFIELFHNPRVCPHMHLSLQSGCDKMLDLMNRMYDTAKYSKVVGWARQLDPLFSITTDIIVGFPGETKDDLTETYRFVENIGFLKVHVFPFSPRPGTPAESMTSDLTKQDKHKRVKKLITAADKTQKQLIEKFIGKEVNVLWESKKADHWYGYTEYYQRVKIKSDDNLENQITTIKLSKNNLVN